MAQLKMFITDIGDESVGISACVWELECPFSRVDVDDEELEQFREMVRVLYNDYSDGVVFVEYDFEFGVNLKKMGLNLQEMMALGYNLL